MLVIVGFLLMLFLLTEVDPALLGTVQLSSEFVQVFCPRTLGQRSLLKQCFVVISERVLCFMYFSIIVSS